MIYEKTLGLLIYYAQLPFLPVVESASERAKGILAELSTRVKGGHQNVIEALARVAFESGNPHASMHAGHLLRKQPIGAATQYVAMLKHPNDFSRRAALYALFPHASEEAIPREMMSLRRDQSPDVRQLAAWLLGCPPVSAERRQQILDGLVADSVEEVMTAAMAAACLNEDEVTSQLWAILETGDKPLKAAAVYGLSSHPSKKLVDEAIALLEDDEIDDANYDIVQFALRLILRNGIKAVDQKKTGDSAEAFHYAIKRLSYPWGKRSLRYCKIAARCLLLTENTEAVNSNLVDFSPPFGTRPEEEAVAVTKSLRGIASDNALLLFSYEMFGAHRLPAISLLGRNGSADGIWHAIDTTVKEIDDPSGRIASAARDLARNRSFVLKEMSTGPDALYDQVSVYLQMLKKPSRQKLSAASPFLCDRHVIQVVASHLQQTIDEELRIGAEIGLHRLPHYAFSIAESILGRLIDTTISSWQSACERFLLSNDTDVQIKNAQEAMQHPCPEIRRWGIMMASTWNQRGLGGSFEDGIVACMKEETDEIVQDALFWVSTTFLTSPTFIGKLLVLFGELEGKPEQELVERLLDCVDPKALAGLLG